LHLSFLQRVKREHPKTSFLQNSKKNHGGKPGFLIFNKKSIYFYYKMNDFNSNNWNTNFCCVPNIIK